MVLLFLFQEALCWFATNTRHQNAWEWERNVRGSRLVCHRTSGALASCDASLKCVAGIGEELVLLWLKISSERDVISTSLWPLLRPRSVLLNTLKRQQCTGLISLLDPWPITLTVLLRVRKEEIRGLTVLLISFKQYDRGSRPNLGEGGPLAGEGVGGMEKGLSEDEGSWDRHQAQTQRDTGPGQQERDGGTDREG